MSPFYDEAVDSLVDELIDRDSEWLKIFLAEDTKGHMAALQALALVCAAPNHKLEPQQAAFQFRCWVKRNAAEWVRDQKEMVDDRCAELEGCALAQ